MLKWYADEDLAIFFTEMPKPRELFPTPKMTDEEIEDIEKKPFIHEKEIRVVLFNHRKKKRFIIDIEKNYRWDGASIPKFLWSLIGSSSDSKFLIPSLVHDKMCENKKLIDYDRYFSTIVFERMLRVSKVPAAKRWAMKHSVDNFQKFKNWDAPKEETQKSENKEQESPQKEVVQ